MVQSSLKVVEQLVSHLYLKQELDLDKARFWMFSAATNLDLRELLSCKTALKKCIPGRLNLGAIPCQKDLHRQSSSGVGT